MNANNAVTLQSLTERVVAAEKAVNDAPLLLKRAMMEKLKAAKANLRVFIYKRKSLNGKVGLVRH